MFGSNDSFVDDGKTEGRVSIEAYRHNLATMIEGARAVGIRPILMTPPRWGPRPVDGLRESPNPRLEVYVQVCRDLADEKKVPLVDHFADWKTAEEQGQALSAWLVDGLHPNPAGHARMAALLLPVLRRELEAGKAP
jgi:acyl-CoA thioesterase-1